MSGIDTIIERARRGGGEFSQRRTFRIARERAISKLRQFALADPHYFVLELIQGAVANGATAIDIVASQRAFVMSYSAAHLSEHELANLFDFMFASKDDLGVVHLRQLALGLNALLGFEPDQILLESGDGTLENTIRLSIQEGGSRIDLGRGTQPLQGTYINATSLKRRRVERRSSLGRHPLGPPEFTAVEERCLSAPVPIVLNGHALFGYSAHRVPPKLFGYSPTKGFDEGDLYGRIGIEQRRVPRFRLLTFGVWIQPIEHVLIDGVRVGGIVNFDRLRKTVDHGAVVRDEVLEELWLRLTPYARQLVEGAGAAELHRIRILDGEVIEPGKLLTWLRDVRRVVVLPAVDYLSDPERERAEEVAGALGVPILCVPDEQIDLLRRVAGASCDIVTSSDTDGEEKAFYRQPELSPPAGPYLAPPVSLVSGEVAELLAMLGKRRDSYVPAQIEAELYFPEETPCVQGTWVQVTTLGRLVWEGTLPGGFDGLWLIVHMPSVGPSRLRQVAEKIAGVLLGRSESTVRDLKQQTVGGVMHAGDQMTPTQRRFGISVLTETAVLRLREHRPEADTAGPSMSLLEGSSGLLDVALFQTLGGGFMSPRQLIATMDSTGGLIYGALEGVEPDLEGLDSRNILRLDAATEALVIALFGSASYVRVDRREILAEHRGVRCRDMALGLRSFPDFPLLVEGADPSGWTEAERDACVGDLVGQLRNLLEGKTILSTDEPAENRRQALLHLQLFACRRILEGTGPAYGVDELPLFGTLVGPMTAASLQSISKPMKAVYSHQIDYAVVEGLPASISEISESVLCASPFLFSLLHTGGYVVPALDFDLSDVEAAENPATRGQSMLLRVPIERDGMVGWLGLPADPQVREGLLVVSSKGRRYDAIGERLRMPFVVGSIRLDSELTAQVAAAISDSVEAALDGLVLEACSFIERGGADQRALTILLAYAEAHLELVRDELGVVRPVTTRPAARPALEVPVHRTRLGEDLAPWDLVRAFCAFGPGALDPESEHAPHRGEQLSELVEDWVSRVLRPERVRQLRARRRPSLAKVGDLSDQDVGRQIEHLLEALRPELPESGAKTLIFFNSPHRKHERREEPVLQVSKHRLPRESKGSIHVTLNTDHHLVGDVHENSASAETWAWLLLAIYAELNRIFEAVTNEHEVLFQMRLIDALEDGKLQPVGTE